MIRILPLVATLIALTALAGARAAAPPANAKNLIYELALRMFDREVAPLALAPEEQRRYESLREETRAAMAAAMDNRLAAMDEITPHLKKEKPDFAAVGAVLKNRFREAPRRMSAHIDRFAGFYANLGGERRERLAAHLRARMDKGREQYEKDGVDPGVKMREGLVKRATEDLRLAPEQVQTLQGALDRLDQDLTPQREGWKAFAAALRERITREKNPDLAPLIADLKSRIESTGEVLLPRLVDGGVAFIESLTEDQRRAFAGDLLEKMATARRWIDRFSY